MRRAGAELSSQVCDHGTERRKGRGREVEVGDSHSMRLTQALPGPGATPQKGKPEVEMKTGGETIAIIAGVAIVAVGLLALACTREPTAE